jgi:acyl-CoA dehydrogenase
MLDTSTRKIFNDDLDMFREQVRKFFATEMVPELDRWEEDGIVPRTFWKKAGAAGLLCPQVPTEYGGMGLDFRFNTVITEELAYTGSSASLPLQSDIIVDYLITYGTKEQKDKWLTGMVTGDVIASIGMTEPGAGSDLQGIRTTAIKDGNDYIINGSKTYISSGQNSDIVFTVCKTDPAAGAKGMSIIIVETDRPGFARGRNLDKIGQNSADTSELFFNDVRVPASNMLGAEGKGFGYLMSNLPQERLSLAIGGQAAAQRAFDEAVAFTKDRKAFGKTVFSFQNTMFTLAKLEAKLQAGWAYLDHCIMRLVNGELTVVEGAASKYFHTELQWEVVDAALQLHGGAGYMNEYPIARLWRDARVQRIHGGTSEIMLEIIGRSL